MSVSIRSSAGSEEYRLSTCIVAHPARRAEATRLAELLARLEPTIEMDPAPTGATLLPARRAWSRVEDDATHHLVIQDDSLIGESFVDHVLASVPEVPTQALAFFTNWGSRTANACRIAALRQAHWAEVCDYYLPAQALILPSGVARSFAGGELGTIERGGRLPTDDLSLFDHVAHHGVAAFVKVPNLVQHGAVPSVSTDSRNGALRRCSVWFEDTPDVSPDTEPVEKLPIVPHFSWSRRRNDWLARPANTTSDRYRWHKVRDIDVLSHFGMSISRLKEDFDQALTSTPDKWKGELDPYMWDLWLTSVGLGIAAASAERELPGVSPAGSAALATLPAGAFQLIVDDEFIEGVASAHAGFAKIGAALGISAVTDGRVRRFDHSIPASLLGPEHLPRHRRPAG